MRFLFWTVAAAGAFLFGCGVCSYITVGMFDIVERFQFIVCEFWQKYNVIQIIKNVIGEAQDPSWKMRLDKCGLHHGLKSTYDLYGASYDRFTEADRVLRN